jgi:hypothetical protein
MSLKPLATAVRATSLSYKLVISSLLLADVSYRLFKAYKRRKVHDKMVFNEQEGKGSDYEDKVRRTNL